MSEFDAAAAALPELSGNDYYTTLSTQWADYLAGMVHNMPTTDYIAYCLRDYDSQSNYSYVDHYVLIYDVEVDADAELVPGSYPYFDIYRSSSNSTYIKSEGYTTVTAVPDLAYGSFGALSELRKGGGVHETYAILFAIVVSFVFIVINGIFNTLLGLGKR